MTPANADPPIRRSHRDDEDEDHEHPNSGRRYVGVLRRRPATSRRYAPAARATWEISPVLPVIASPLVCHRSRRRSMRRGAAADASDTRASHTSPTLPGASADGGRGPPVRELVCPRTFESRDRLSGSGSSPQRATYHVGEPLRETQRQHSFRARSRERDAAGVLDPRRRPPRDRARRLGSYQSRQLERSSSADAARRVERVSRGSACVRARHASRTADTRRTRHPAPRR